MALVLASQSVRRRELMALVAADFVLDEAAVDETATRGLPPVCLARELARQKACAVAARRPRDVVIGCDTVVELEGRPLGKPQNPAAARAMLAALSGRRHWVHTGLCVAAENKAPDSFSETTAVNFAPLPAGEIEAYIATDEPYDKAGGYGIQGWAARYVLRVEGCYYNVMGLPVARLYHRLLALGLFPGR
jgi:septum formation protein